MPYGNLYFSATFYYINIRFTTLKLKSLLNSNYKTKGFYRKTAILLLRKGDIMREDDLEAVIALFTNLVKSLGPSTYDEGKHDPHIPGDVEVKELNRYLVRLECENWTMNIYRDATEGEIAERVMRFYECGVPILQAESFAPFSQDWYILVDHTVMGLPEK